MAHIEQLNLLQMAWLILALFALRRLLRPLYDGAPGILLDVRGAAARDDRPVLLAGNQPLPAEGGELRFAVRPLRPEAAWLTGGEQPQDGRYIVYIKDQANPDGPGLPVAKFNLRGGRLADFEPVPLPATAVP